MRTLVYGAGPLGSLLAARLHGAGVDVALLARGQRLADLHTHGVVLEDSHSGERTNHDVRIVEELAPEDRYDLVCVVMRKDQSAAILPALARNQHAHTVLFLQNNAAGFADYVDALGAERVMAGFPTAGGQRLDPVMRVMPMAAVPMPIGEIDDSVTERTRQVAALLGRSGKRVRIERDIDSWLVTHVPAVGAFFGIIAADGDPARYARTRDAMLLGVRARAEALAAQEAAGIPIRPAALRSVRWLPEPLAVATLWALSGTTFFEVGVAGHARDGREELAHVLAEYRARVAPGGVAMPSLDAIAAHAEGQVPPLADGSADLPLRWGGLAGLLAGLAVAAVAGRSARRTRRA